MRPWMKSLLLIIVGISIGWGVAKMMAVERHHPESKNTPSNAATVSQRPFQSAAPPDAAHAKRNHLAPDAVLQRLLEDLPATASESGTTEAIDVPELRQQLQELRDQVQELTDEVTLIRGNPLAFPDDTESRFQPAAVRTALNEALRQRGVSSEVEALDCDEFPCIGCGRISTGQDERWVGDEIERIRGVDETAALEPYQDAEQKTSVWKSLGDPKEGEPGATFCMTLYPNDVYSPDEVNKRTGYRTREMLKGM